MTVTDVYHHIEGVASDSAVRGLYSCICNSRLCSIIWNTTRERLQRVACLVDFRWSGHLGAEVAYNRTLGRLHRLAR